MTNKLVDNIANLREGEALALVKEMLATGTDPMVLLEGCRDAMEMVGERFKKGVYFLPDLIYAGEIMRQVSAEVKPYINTAEAEGKKGGKILIGTVKGDIHDIGKNIVTFMLDVNGFDVRDIGVDVPPETFVEHIRSFEPDIVALSGLLTVAHTTMKETVEAIKAAGLRERVKIMVGGGSIDEHVRVFAGADAYGPDAMAAVSLARQWTGVK
ncbi:cobalamin B12-binding domain-containing protein [Moorella sp. E306M]|jgi:5-methyltetrahydrofolate--homocysteine methyltransferase|uniref:cobalamin B12-binding domain-containing protein n=1 Tax=Moorella sp. E306M TaxID=2572683 RepID=UPI0010FFBA42|nr:cobalamin-dependent protein [Moorella sp. E306M]GEA17294.1 cobalamin-binding protein [Moorella sp. E306M]